MTEASKTTDSAIASLAGSAAEVEAVAEYKSLSGMAILGLLLGLASPVVLVSPLYTVVPLAGAAVSLVALAKIKSSEGQLIGRSAALVGLCLSVGLIGVAQGRAYAQHWRMAQQAELVARQWLGHLLADQPQQAFGLTSAATRAASPNDTRADEPGPAPSTQPPLEQFLERPLVVQLLNLVAPAEIRLLETEWTKRVTANLAYVNQRYEVVPDQGQSVQLTIALEQRGQVTDGTAPAWRVLDFQPPDTAE